MSVLVNKYRYLVFKHEYNANAAFIYSLRGNPFEATSFYEVQPDLLSYIIIIIKTPT